MAGRRQLREGGHCWDEAPGMAASQRGTHGERRHHGIVRGPPAAEGICVCHNHRNFQSLSTQKHWRVSPSDGPRFRRKSIVYANICSPGRRLGNYLFLVYDFQHMLQAAARQKRDGRARLSRACPPPRQHRYFRRPRTVPSPPPPDTQRLLLCPSDRSLNSQPGLAQVLPTPPQLGGAQVPVAGLWGVAQPPRSGCSRGTPPPPPHCRGAASPAGAPSVWAFSALSPSPFCLCQFCGSRARRRRGGGAAWIPSAAAAVCLGPAWTDAPAGVA